MPITLYCGPPGSGKSFALVERVMVPAVKAGRRVLTNVDGVKPDAIEGYLLERMKPGEDAASLGSIVLFHGEDMLKPGFFPDEATEKAGLVTTVRPGDLLIIDEYAMYLPQAGPWPEGCNFEDFCRWHRHLTGEKGQATDIAIATQAYTDLHRRIRPLVQTSYKFLKLTALGADKRFSFSAFQGANQTKKRYDNGTGKYDPEIFPLYKSSAAAAEGTHAELKTDKRGSIWGGWKAKATVAAMVILPIGGGLGLVKAWGDMGGDSVPAVAATQGAAAPVGAVGAGAGQPGQPVAAAAPRSVWRIVGTVESDFGTRVVVADKAGTTRLLLPQDFQFDEGRPVSGLVDGERATAEDRLPDVPASSDRSFGVELAQ